jgi:protein tyrosine phosphatase (PTP) superfamily phosphohydrolase (DUF442 family)
MKSESERSLNTTDGKRDSTLEETSRSEVRRFTKKWLELFKDLIMGLLIMNAYAWMSEVVVRLIRGAPIRSYSQISPHLFIGGQYRKKGWPLLESWGITAVVNLRNTFDDKQAGIAPAHYLHLPTRDGHCPTQAQLRAGVKFIKEEIEQGGAVYIHCEAGVGRSATLMAAYLIDEEKLTSTQAWKKIRSVRPFIRPTSMQKRGIDRFADRS